MPTPLELSQKGTTTLCMIVKVTATAGKGGGIVRFALASRDITYAGEVYKAVSFEVSQFQSTSGTEVDNATFSTALSSAFDRLQIRGGIWAGATVEIMMVDYLNLSVGYVQRQKGRFGQATIAGLEAQIEYRGMTQMLSQEIGEKTSRLCRYQLGDEDCTKNITAYTFTGTITAVTNKQKFTISVAKPDDYFYRGKITFTSGANNGLSMETTANVGTLLTLFQPMLGAVAVGDAFSIVAGDDKTITTCHTKFANAVNFGGEPSMPMREDLFRFPD